MRKRLSILFSFFLLIGLFASAQPAEASCSGVSVTTSSNIQNLINSNPTGTTFCFASGTYTNADSLTPKNNDLFDGASQSAILDGGNTRQYSFVDGGSESSGTDDGVSSVTIQGFKIQNYATPLQKGAITAFSGNHWIIQNNDIENNAAAAVVTGDNVQVLNNTLSNNFEEGFNAQGTGGLYQGNTIDGNNSALNTCGTNGPCADWEAGGGKAWSSTSLTFKNNDIEGNGGPGLWVDTNNIDTTFDGNTIKNNYSAGIYEEISYDFKIINNDIEGNGVGSAPGGGENQSWAWGAGIQIRRSQGNVSGNGITGYGDSIIANNTVYDNYNGINLIESPTSGCTGTGEGAYGACKVAHVVVENNGITMAQGSSGGMDDGDSDIYTNNNSWSGNNWCVNPTRPNPDPSGFGDWIQWVDGNESWSQWQGFGFDTNGTITGTLSKCNPPTPQVPAVTTTAATAVTATGATLNGTVNPEAQATTYQFQYGTTTSYGSVAPASPGSAGSGNSAVNESASISGLTANTTYHYRLNATNSTGTTNGSDQTFTTSVTSVAYDATGPSSSGSKCTSCSSLSWTHSVGSSGTNRALLVGVAVSSGNDRNCSVTVMDGTTTLTKLSGPIHTNTNGQHAGFESVYYLVNPPTGSNSMSMSVSGCSGAPSALSGGSISFTGVDQTTPFGTPVTANGSGTTASATISSTSNDMIAAFAAYGININSASSPLTSRYIANNGNYDGAGNSAGATATSTGSNITTSWTSSSSDWWAVIDVQVNHS
jgi:hypothetical protein